MINENQQKSINEIEIVKDDDFSYEGFQVVRGEFFSHIYLSEFWEGAIYRL